MTIPGVGPVTASAIVATIQDAGAFASGQFAAFLGLTPRQNSTGGKTRLGRITKMGDRYLRKRDARIRPESTYRGRSGTRPRRVSWAERGHPRFRPDRKHAARERTSRYVGPI
jgi:transposase